MSGAIMVVALRHRDADARRLLRFLDDEIPERATASAREVEGHHDANAANLNEPAADQDPRSRHRLVGNRPPEQVIIVVDAEPLEKGELIARQLDGSAPEPSR